jgi:hypothetical protein
LARREEENMKINILDLIQYIVCYATEKGMKLSPIRLVKFLYLADLYWARESEGAILTKWPWKFVHYGPFCNESLDAIEKAFQSELIQRSAYESKYADEDYFLYWCKENSTDIERKLPIYLTSPLHEAISKWGDDTFGLLDYVYFETEPMLDAKKGDLLDFSKAKKPEVPKEIEMVKLSSKQLAKGKEIMERLKSKYKEGFQRAELLNPIYDETYKQGIKSLDDEDLEGELSGKSEISVD